MKKTLIAAACVLATLAGMAQGTINFANSSTTLIRYGTTPDVDPALAGLAVGVAGGPALAEWSAALYWLDPSSSVFAQLGAKSSLSLNGRFIGGQRGNAAGPAGTETFKVVAWSGAFSSYEAAVASGSAAVYVGESPSFSAATGGGTTPAGSITGFDAQSNPIKFTGMNVRPVPEPSIVALGLLGAAALLIRRRN